MLVKEKLRLLITEGRTTQLITTESFEFPTPSVIYDDIFQNTERERKKAIERVWHFLFLSSAVFSYYNHYNTYALN
jgi:hypothetical protein